MITTVTTTTVTTVSTFGSVTLASFAIITLMLLLVSKESLLHSTTERARRLRKVFNIAIIPLVIVFLFTVVTHFIKLMS